MSKCRALYSKAAQTRVAHAQVELERDTLLVTMPDGRWRMLRLNGSRFVVRDAACSQRFVRHLEIRLAGERADFITPPDEGAIAPRAVRLPGVPDDVAVVATGEWEAMVDWIQGSGRRGGRTVAELARLACIATSQFAITVGEWAAQVAMEMSWERSGPMRSSLGLRHTLRPLEEAANNSPRAADAYVAALSHSVTSRRDPGRDY